MEALTALSLAGTIIQFVDFGTKFFSTGQEIYQSTTGRLKVEEDLELVVTDLTAVVRKLQQRAPSVSSDLPGNLTEEAQTHQKRFELICDDAAQIAKDILTRIDKLKRTGTKKDKWKTFREVLNRLWSKEELGRLQERLDTLRKAIDIRMLSVILDTLNSQSTQITTCLCNLDQKTQTIISSLLAVNQTLSRDISAIVLATNQELSQEMTRNVSTALAQLFSRLEALNQDDHRRIRKTIVEVQQRGYENGEEHEDNEDMCEEETPEIVADIEMLDVSTNQEDSLRLQVQSRTLTALYYPMMTSRYESVVDAHPTTFDWTFQDSTDEQLPWANFSSWLKTGNGVYWINGKPGSGKTTLMKHIFDDHRTRQCLHEWASQAGAGASVNAPLCVATFFFWNSGAVEQRSQIGMLRALLFQILSEHPDLTPLVLPTTWAKIYSKLVKRDKIFLAEPWSLRELVYGFRHLLVQTQVPIKLFLLVDGLDEFEGDPDDLVDLFKDLATTRSSCVKACLSSRAWVEFKVSFEGCPTLQLQNLTFDDIKRFVNDKFYGNASFANFSTSDSKSATALIREVVRKADGVFLWVRIVVKALLNGVRNCDSIPDLWQRLNALPESLILLYEHLHARIEPMYLPWASKAFQITRAVRELENAPLPTLARNKGKGNPGYVADSDGEAGGCLSIWEFYMAVNELLDPRTIGDMSPEAVANECQRTEIHLTARCGMLLEIVATRQQRHVGPTSPIRYLHRTARDFLENHGRWAEVVAHTRERGFDPYLAVLRSCNLGLHRLLRHGEDPKGCSYQQIASKAMIFASHADQHSESYKGQMKILEDVDRIITSLTRIPML